MFGPAQLAKMGAEESGENRQIILSEAKSMPESQSPPEKGARLSSPGVAKGSKSSVIVHYEHI